MEITITKALQEPMFEMKKQHFHIGRDEIIFLCSGSRRFFANYTVYTMNEGDLMYVPAGCLHRTAYNDSHSAERFVLSFPDTLSEYTDYFQRETLFHTSKDPEIKEIFEKILYEKDNNIIHSEEMQIILIKMLLIKLIRMPSAFSAISEKTANTNDERIQHTAEWICEHFQEKITLEDASQYAGFSRTYFSQKFKAVTGFGFNDYLTAIRLKNALKFILTTNLSVMEIAYKCGFNDSNYFGSVFHKHFGLSPYEYRKKYGDL